MISCITVTYGRVKWLQQAIAGFLAQDWTGPKEHLILNTFPKQNLVCDLPNIRIINLEERPPSLGFARNIAIGHAMGEHIVTWDDDDSYLPHFLRTFEENWPDGIDWVWLDKRLCAEGDKITQIRPGCHGGCFGFTKAAWKAEGGYPELTVGEDRVLVQKITKHNGRKLMLGDSLPPFICRWGNGTYHISGQGNDKPGSIPAHQRIAIDLHRRVAARQERVGTIQLKPDKGVDWLGQAAEFMTGLKKKMDNNDVCIVELGRYGDIVNILPIALYIHNTYRKPHFVVSREFASILDGVSYVTPHVVDIANDQLHKGMEIARNNFGHVVRTQIWGTQWEQEHLCQSYNMESWRQGGFLHKFKDPAWRPAFDRRDHAREQAVISKLRTTAKPFIIVNVTHSHSSPFQQSKEVWTMLNLWLADKYELLDVSQLTLTRVYDLLGLIEQAAIVISIDTALIHFAAATTTPIVCLVNEKGWAGTTPRTMRSVVLKYDEACNFVALRKAIDTALEMSASTVELPPALSIVAAPTRRIFHVCEKHREKNSNEIKRKTAAQRSWQVLYDQGVIPIHYQNYTRSATSLGDPRDLPFLKDCLQAALKEANDDDIIFITNDDNFLHSKLPDLLQFHVSLFECCSSQRCEFRIRPMPPPTASPQEFAALCQSHMGRDLFAFTKRWLVRKWSEIGDFVLGCSDWDLALASLVRLEFGIETTRLNLEKAFYPAELPKGYIAHSYHYPAWENPAYVNTSPGQQHNRRLFKEWASTHLPALVFHPPHNII